MKSNPGNNESSVRPSTYSLLVRSEEKQRNIFETVIYALFVLCAVVGVWQFVQQPITVPTRISNEEQTLAVNVVCGADVRC